MMNNHELAKQAKHAGKPLWKKTIDEAKDANKHEVYMNKLQKKQNEYNETQQQKEQLYDLINREGYGDDPLDIEHFLRNNSKGNAANTIQSAFRNKIAKREIKNAKIAKVSNNAASTLQAALRRKNTSKTNKGSAELNKKSADISSKVLQDALKEVDTEHNAAVTIQKRTRGMKARDDYNYGKK